LPHPANRRIIGVSSRQLGNPAEEHSHQGGGSMANQERGEIYGEGARQLQDRFETRALADRIPSVSMRAEFNQRDKDFIESLPYFFVATVGDDGLPQCSYKGGWPGFVQVSGPTELIFPSFDGNGMYLSLGNMIDTGKIGLLFIDFEKARRIRVNGRASLIEAGGETRSAQMFVRVRASQILNNCPRHVHKMKMEELSRFTPTGPDQDIGKMAVREEYQDVIPERMKMKS
jgi:predicted pyridoxine 5'-phosphate oxidase superfamily flavin-nucleotide-binding protein